jgi:hypothetical protein
MEYTMLKVSKDSWHYKLAYDNFVARLLAKTDSVFAPKQDPDSLCPYMRQVLKPPFVLFIAIGLALGIGFNIYMLVEYGWFKNWPEGLLEGMHIVPALICIAFIGFSFMLIGCGLFLAALFIIGVGTMYLMEEIVEPRKRARIEANGGEPPPPNIISQWLHALHRGVCPLLEIEEKKDDVNPL